MPAWVAAKLVGNRKKASADPAKPRYKMNLTLSFAGIEDKDLIERAKEQLGDEKLTDIILDAVRKELGQ